MGKYVDQDLTNAHGDIQVNGNKGKHSRGDLGAATCFSI